MAAPDHPSSGPRARYAQRVTPEHVRSRVSVRYLVDDDERGPVPTDVVGRLLAYGDDTLMVLDRKSRLHVIEAARLLASKPVPPHPKLPPEPDVGTQDQPLMRRASRVILLDDEDRILLASFSPRPDETIWTAPGGGLDPDETHEDAAVREIREELRLTIELGPWVWTRRETFAFRNVWIDQAERWFVARTGSEVVGHDAPLDPGMDRVRWWTRHELHASSELFAPRELARHLDELLDAGPPAEPIDVGR